MESTLFEDIKQFTEIRGVIQVGYNIGQELNTIKNYTKNIICFEPVPPVFDYLKKSNPDVICYNIGLGDTDEAKDMYIATNNGESSSFLKPLNHTTAFPHIEFRKSIEPLQIRRFDSLDIDLTNYNILFSDTQGYEIQVLKGFGTLLEKIDIIYVEYINAEFYEGDSSLEQITEYLSGHSFKLHKTYEDAGSWGNAMYIKIK